MKTPDTPLGRYLRHLAHANHYIFKEVLSAIPKTEKQ